MKRLDDLIVVEIGGSLAGAYCAKLFADHGASVTLVGDRNLPASQADYLDGSKRRAERFENGLAARADIVIESTADGPLVPLGELRRAIVHVQISPFGGHGPHAAWRSSDLVDQAMGGHLTLSGDPRREPLRGPPDQPKYAAALVAFVGAMAALWARRTTGEGQVVEVAHQEVLAALHEGTLLRSTLGHEVLRRKGNRPAAGARPSGLYRSANGWVCLSAPTAGHVERLLEVTGLTSLLDQPGVASPLDLQARPGMIDEALVPWLASRSTAEIVELCQANRVPAAAANDMGSLLSDHQLKARRFWRTRDDGRRAPGPPFRLSGRTWNGAGDPSMARNWAAPTTSTSSLIPGGPLQDVRVLDLTRVWGGPLATRLLAELGADVISVEAPGARGPRRWPESLVESVRYFPRNDQGESPWNRNGHVAKYGLGKRSLCLDLSDRHGRSAFERLVPTADVLVENYTARVMPQVGLDEARLHELNPSLIYVTMPAYGRSGPAKDWVADGSTLEAHAGLCSLMGYPDATPWKGGLAWPDPIAGLHAVAATMLALWDREAVDDDEPRRGQTVECAQLEATVAVVGDRLLAVQADQQSCASSSVRHGPGNRDPRYAPQGVYPCMGDDRWIAISVEDDASWVALCDQIGIDDTELRALPTDERYRHHDAIDELLAVWCAGFGQRELTVLLQGAGVAAAPVLDATGVLGDPHLRSRRFFAEVEQPELGRLVTPVLPVRLSATPARIRRPAPRLGEHNVEVLKDLAGLGPDDIADLVDRGAVATRPPT